MDLVLVRHALPQRVESGSVAGPADPGLSDTGRAQAERLAAWLAAEPIDAVLTSPLRRARETAAPLAATLSLEPEVVDGVAEYDAAAGEYIPMEELRATKDERWFATIEGRWADVGGVDPLEFQQRVVPAVDEVIERFAGQRVVVVTHGGVLNVYLAHVIGTARLLWFHPAYTSISRVAAARTGPRSIETLNETAHLLARRVPPEEVPA